MRWCSKIVNFIMLRVDYVPNSIYRDSFGIDIIDIKI